MNRSHIFEDVSVIEEHEIKIKQKEAKKHKGKANKK